MGGDPGGALDTHEKEVSGMSTRKAVLASDGFTMMIREAVTAGKEWTVAMREASIDPMLKLFAWNQPMIAILEPWVEMTRQAHDRWLECWESQSHDIIDRTTRAVETGARHMTKEASA